MYLLLWSQMVGIPLPFAEHDGTNTDIYDLYSVVRGTTNKDLVPYVPPVWKPYHDQIPQVHIQSSAYFLSLFTV